MPVPPRSNRLSTLRVTSQTALSQTGHFWPVVSGVHVGAAAETLPDALVAQLRPGGRLVIPVGVFSQQLVCVDKDAKGCATQRDLMPVVYVPLVRTTAG